MWTLLDDRRSWARRAAVGREGIVATARQIWLDWFGERSGAVVMCTADVLGRLVLSLETKEVTHMPADEALWWLCCLYEMDLLSLIVALKSL